VAVVAVDFLMGPGLLSWTIGRFGQGPGGYSHCASVLKDGRYLDARDDKLDGVEPGIHIREPKTEAWIRKRRATLTVTQTEYEDWEANLRAKIGDKYASRDIVGFIVDRMMHRVATYDCSALVVNALQHIKKVPFPLPVPAHEITPNGALLVVGTAGFIFQPELARL
jgi:hypothetical protein